MNDNITQLVRSAPQADDPHKSHTGQLAFDLYMQGLSYTKIAELIGRTKSAVAGLIDRFRAKHNLPPRPKVVRKPNSVIAKPNSVSKPPRFTQDIIAQSESLSVPVGSFNEVLEKNTCRYIYGDPKIKPKFCGNPRHGRYSYCAEHVRICYQ